MEYIKPKKQTKDKVITINAEDLVNIISQNLEEVFDELPTVVLEMFAASITCDIIRKSEENKKEEKPTPKPTENKEEKKNAEDIIKKYDEAVSNALADLVKTLFEKRGN